MADYIVVVNLHRLLDGGGAGGDRGKRGAVRAPSAESMATRFGDRGHYRAVNG